MGGVLVRPVLALALLLAGPAMAAPPAPDSEDAAIFHGFEEWIGQQHSPIGMFCCTASDGRPLFDNEIRRRDGHWEVFYSSKHFSDGTDVWLVVPDSAILPQNSPIGFPIAWILAGRVYCLILAGSV